jgi:hypothetical protein
LESDLSGQASFASWPGRNARHEAFRSTPSGLPVRPLTSATRRAAGMLRNIAFISTLTSELLFDAFLTWDIISRLERIAMLDQPSGRVADPV